MEKMSRRIESTDQKDGTLQVRMKHLGFHIFILTLYTSFDALLCCISFSVYVT